MKQHKRVASRYDLENSGVAKDKRNNNNYRIVMASPERGSRRAITHELKKDAESYRSATRRAKTTTHVDGYSAEGNPEKYASQLFSWDLARLEQSQLRTNRMVQQHFHYMLPNAGTSPDQLHVHDALHYRPMTVTNEELAEIINLELSTADSPSTPDGVHFYMRSWTLTGGQFRAILSEMTESEYTFDETEEWRKVLDLYHAVAPDRQDDLEAVTITNEDLSALPAATQPAIERQQISTAEFIEHAADHAARLFTVRYIGKVSGPRRPYDRYTEDLRDRTSGVLYEFQEVLDRVFPALTDSAKIHMFKDASLDLPGKHNMWNADDVERVLIEHFDHATLLNRQRGGCFASYIPLQEDVDTFRALNIRFYHRFLQSSSVASPGDHAALVQYYRSIQEYTNNNPTETGASQHRFNDQLRESSLNQGTPRLYKDTAVLLILVGDDITRDDYVNAKTFLRGGSQAGNSSFDYLDRLTRLESDNALPTERPGLDTSPFPFVDLWQWLWQHDLAEATTFLRQYFRITRPIIAVSFGRGVNKITKANLQDEYSTRIHAFSTMVGDLTVQYYDVDESGQPVGESAFINIPHIHPGRDKHSSNNLLFRRVMDLTWHKTFLVASVAMDLIDDFVGRGEQKLHRAQFCADVIRRVNELSTNQHYQSFFTNYEQTKVDLAKQRNGPTAPSAEDVRPVMNEAGRLKLAALGRAEGEAHSEERHKQLQQYWSRNVPELHLHVSHDDGNANFDAWKAEFLPLQKGQFFYTQVLSKLPADEYVEHLLRAVQPGWVEDTSWMLASTRRAAAELRCGLWFHRNKLKDDGRKVIIVSLFPDYYATAYDMQGRAVGVAESCGSMVLRWLRDDGSKVDVRLNVKPAKPGAKINDQSRFVSFTEEGIDIVDAQGNPLRFQVRTDMLAPASVTRAALAGTEGGLMTLELWKAVRRAHDHKVEDDEIVADAQKWDQEKGLKAIARTAKAEKPRQNRPPGTQDANYLLDEFLKQRFPSSGIFRTQSADRLADSTEDLQAFVAFLKTPEFLQHPYQVFWHAALTRSPPDVALLGKNLRVLRSVKQVKSVRHSGDNLVASVPVKETVFHIGPPGSALDDAFATVDSDDGEGEDGDDNQSQASATKRKAS